MKLKKLLPVFVTAEGVPPKVLLPLLALADVPPKMLPPVIVSAEAVPLKKLLPVLVSAEDVAPKRLLPVLVIGDDVLPKGALVRFPRPVSLALVSVDSTVVVADTDEAEVDGTTEDPNLKIGAAIKEGAEADIARLLLVSVFVVVALTAMA